MTNLNILIKPASEKCNMDCKYCFYHDISSKREIKDYGFMSEETMNVIIDRAFESGAKTINFAFQGGEPTLWGVDNFKSFISYVNLKKIEAHRKITYSLQTNGTLITEEYAQLFKENRFLIGLSLDGIRKINDKNRPYINGKATFDDILSASRIFNQYKVAYNILAVVNKEHIGHEKEVYNFYKKNNFRYLQFIAVLDPIGQDKGMEKWSLSPNDYYSFLNEMFKLWYSDFKKGEFVDIRYFSNVISMLCGGIAESCDRRGICSIQNIVEADGSVYPCDFYVFENEKLGKLYQDSFTQMMNSDKAKEFVKRSMIIHPDCQKCEYLNLCRGGCYRNRNEIDGSMKNYYCQSYYNFFKNNLDKLQEVAKIAQMRR